MEITKKNILDSSRPKIISVRWTKPLDLITRYTQGTGMYILQVIPMASLFFLCKFCPPTYILPYMAKHTQKEQKLLISAQKSEKKSFKNFLCSVFNYKTYRFKFVMGSILSLISRGIWQKVFRTYMKFPERKIFVAPVPYKPQSPLRKFSHLFFTV